MNLSAAPLTEEATPAAGGGRRDHHHEQNAFAAMFDQSNPPNHQPGPPGLCTIPPAVAASILQVIAEPAAPTESVPPTNQHNDASGVVDEPPISDNDSDDEDLSHHEPSFPSEIDEEQ